MDHLREYAKILLFVLTISQVCGNPMFFLSQQEPDCSQQNNNDNSNQNYQQNTYQGYQVPSYQVPSYQAPSYKGSNYQGSNYQGPSYQGAAYQGPSYQETLQAMIADTLRALCDIVQSTVQASKQEIATLARMFIKKSSQANCESDETPEEEYNVQPNEPTDNDVAEPQSVTNIGMETSSSEPSLLTFNKNDSSANTSEAVNNSTSLVSTMLKAGLNATSTSLPLTNPANSTTEKTNPETHNQSVSVTGAQNSNKTVSEVTTLMS